MSNRKSDVWTQRQSGLHTMSRSAYLMAICLWTAAGIAVSAVAAYLAQGIDFKAMTDATGLLFILGLFGISLLGVFISTKADTVGGKLIGYIIMTVAMGIMCAPLVAAYTTASVAMAFGLTSAAVLLLGVVGAVIKYDLSNMGMFLFGALVALIVGMVGTAIFGVMGIHVTVMMAVLNVVGVLIFSLYVVYDLNRAVRMDYTMTNAVEVAVSVYLDFINLFIRLLELLGQKND